MYLPHMPQPPHETRRTGGRVGKPGGGDNRPDVTEGARHFPHLGRDARGELVITGLIIHGRGAEV
jgi:hypothetical protein